MQARRNTETVNPFSQFSSRKLWELLQCPTSRENEACARAAREELIQRGAFQPNAAWTAPH